MINTGKRVIELERDCKEHESILKNEIERVEEEKKSLEEEKESLVFRVKKLEEDMQVMVEKQVEEMNKVVAESKASCNVPNFRINLNFLNLINKHI